MTPQRWDIVVVGSGPAGQKAALHGAATGKRVLIVEKIRSVGGACVHYGTIPSKTLRETTVALTLSRQRSGNVFHHTLPESTKIEALMKRLDTVIGGYEHYIGGELERSGVARLHGRARFVSDRVLEIRSVGGGRTRVEAEIVIIAVGSRPRTPAHIPVDHEHILDSDSILSLSYLPKSLLVLGGGVIASEYASIFAALGVKATMVDKYPAPVGFLDPELTNRFVTAFERNGGRWKGESKIRSVGWNGVQVNVELSTGEILVADKLLCAMGREAPLKELGIAAAGLEATERGLLKVDAFCRTNVPHIYAVGDVIGPPALAASAMEQGRRAICHALNLDAGAPLETIPAGIYTIPEMSSVGLDERRAGEKHGGVVIGRCRFEEIARGHIAGIRNGFMKMVADGEGRRLLGVQIVGEGATELVHIGQMGLLSGWEVDRFVENIFNFPTLAEAYRVAALDIVRKRTAHGRAAVGSPQRKGI